MPIDQKPAGRCKPGRQKDDTTERTENNIEKRLIIGIAAEFFATEKATSAGQ